MCTPDRKWALPHEIIVGGPFFSSLVGVAVAAAEATHIVLQVLRHSSRRPQFFPRTNLFFFGGRLGRQVGGGVRMAQYLNDYVREKERKAVKPADGLIDCPVVLSVSDGSTGRRPVGFRRKTSPCHLKQQQRKKVKYSRGTSKEAKENTESHERGTHVYMHNPTSFNNGRRRWCPRLAKETWVAEDETNKNKTHSQRLRPLEPPPPHPRQQQRLRGTSSSWRDCPRTGTGPATSHPREEFGSAEKRRSAWMPLPMVKTPPRRGWTSFMFVCVFWCSRWRGAG